MDVADYRAGSHYELGVRVMHNGAIYQCIRAHGENTPDRNPETETTYWSPLIKPIRTFAEFPDRPATYPSEAHDHPQAPPPAHPDAAGHKALGVATTADLTAHAGTPHGGGAAPEVKRLTADGTAVNTNAAFTNFANLNFPIAAGEQVEFEARILHRAAAATTGLVLAVGGPAVTLLHAEAYTWTTAVATVKAFATAIDGPITLTGVVTANTDQWAYLTGVIVASAAGTVQLKYRSEVNLSAVTPKRGSWLRVVSRV